jgi:ActR/RegA family two-component response regulator
MDVESCKGETMAKQKEIDILIEFVRGYDRFMQSDLKISIDNPGWAQISIAADMARRNISEAGRSKSIYESDEEWAKEE